MALTDFGWRLHGRPTGAVPDHSFDLQRAAELARHDRQVLRRHGRYLGPLEACLQCGACSCSLK